MSKENLKVMENIIGRMGQYLKVFTALICEVTF